VKNAISCFPVLPVKAQVIWGGTLKRPLIAYFVGNISAKKYQAAFTDVCLSYSKPKVGHF